MSRSHALPNASRRGAIRIPGLPVLPPHTERHPVPGGGSRVLPLQEGDQLTVDGVVE